MAFIDSGFSMHPDIASRVVTHVDASTTHIVEQTSIAETSPMSWHGQMTSVIAAGDGTSSNGRYRGIAYEAKLVLIKVSTPDFHIKERDIMRGLQWVYDARYRHDIRVVNISVGGDEVSNNPNHMLHRIVRKLYDMGIVVVIAAGNSGKSYLVPPASAPQALAIGGYDDQNSANRANWTLYHHNHGKVYDGSMKPDFLAPSTWIASPILPQSSVEAEMKWLSQMLQVQTDEELKAILQKAYQDLKLSHDEIENLDFKLYQKLQDRIYYHKVIDAHHQHVDGTSVAAPIVAAVIAQMFEANENLTPAQVCNILKSTAKILPAFDASLQGAGLIDAQAAVYAARNAST